MTERGCTFASLSKDFDMSEKEVRRLAFECGIPTRPRGRLLTDKESDRLYDAWLSLNVKRAEASSVSSRMIFIDTSSLLQPGAEVFLKNASTELLMTGQKLIVPFVVIVELSRKALQSENPELAKRARNILNSILNYKEMGIIAVYGDDNDGTFADNVFHKIAAMFALRKELVFITQDYKLGQDLLMMLHMGSVRNRKISVCKLDTHGQLSIVDWKG